MNQSATITEVHGRPYNDAELKNAFQLVVNALLGENASGEWVSGLDRGYWVKRGFLWSAKITSESFPSGGITAPFKMIDCVVNAYNLTTPSSVTRISQYIDGSKQIDFPTLVGKKVQITIDMTKITKD